MRERLNLVNESKVITASSGCAYEINKEMKIVLLESEPRRAHFDK